MRVFDSPAALQELEAGTELGTSDWLEVTQEMINLFADATKDHQWIHIDEERAKAGPFGTTIAHGYLTMSLVPDLSHGIWSIEKAAMIVNYGADKLRFLTPVPSGGRIRVRVNFNSATEGGSGLRVINDVTVELEGSEKPALIMSQIMLVVG